LRKDGFDIKQIHHFIHFTDEELELIIRDFAAKGGKVVCISTSFIAQRIPPALRMNSERPGGIMWGVSPKGIDVYKKLLQICKVAKLICKCKVVMGGWEIEKRKFYSSNMKSWGLDVLRHVVDCFVEGYGSNVIKKIALDQPIKTDQNKLIQSDAIIDFSDMSSAPILADNIEQGESLMFEIASGCIFSCHFCNFGSLGKKKNEYMRSYESLKTELVSNYENFGTRMYNLTDNIANDYLEKMKWLVRIKDETGIDFKWSGYVRLDTIKNREQAQILKDSGMVGALMGIESMTPSVGKYIGKMTDGERIKDLLRMCRDVWKDDALIYGMFIAGLPTETKEMTIETFSYLTSDEGRDLIDSFKFSRLAIEGDLDNKNEINKARNGPFRDYEVRSASDWTSPWHNSAEIEKITNHINHYENQKTDINAHNISQICNLGYTPEEAISLARSGMKRGDYDYYAKTSAKYRDYRSRIMAEISS